MSKDKIPTLDLHGRTTDEVFDVVDAFLRKHDAAPRVRILHGKGTGKVKAKVLEYLKLSRHQSQPERNEKGQINEGSLIVFT